jgi:hypothetical protein
MRTGNRQLQLKRRIDGYFAQDPKEQAVFRTRPGDNANGAFHV